MEMQEIEIDIDRNGNVKLHVRGIAGEGCLVTTADLERALGTVESREMTPEAWDTQSIRVDQQNRSGY